MAIEYRPVVEAEFLETVEIFLTSVADMYRRTGINAPLPPREFISLNYGHVFRTGLFYVAEVDDRLAAICHAVVRDELWFLSGFWALPDSQRRGLGGPLLKIVHEEGRRAGAKTFFTWSSVDLPAMASYMKVSMLPGYQILTFAGRPKDMSAQGAESITQPLSLQAAMEIDREVRATSREADHRFWLEEAGYQGRQLVSDGEVRGYFYFKGGTIGSAAWLDEDAGGDLLQRAVQEVSEHSEEVRLMIPGVNHLAIRFALNAGLRLTAFSHLLMSAPFGRMEQYLSSGPSLF